MAADGSGTGALTGDSMMEFELPGEEKKKRSEAKTVEISGIESESSESSDEEKKSSVEQVRDLELELESDDLRSYRELKLLNLSKEEELLF